MFSGDFVVVLKPDDEGISTSTINETDYTGRMRVVAEFVSLCDPKEKYNLVKREKFDPKKYVGVFYNEQLMSYDSFSKNVRNFRRGDFTENIESTNDNQQPNFYTFSLKNNKNPNKVEVTTKDIRNVVNVQFANYEEKKVKKIVIKCPKCFENGGCSHTVKESLEKFETKKVEIPVADFHTEIKDILNNDKKKYIGDSDENKYNVKGNFLYKGFFLWSFCTDKSEGYLMLMTDVSEDTIEYLVLMKLHHHDDYIGLLNEINNKYQTRNAKRGQRWKNYMDENCITDRMIELMKKVKNEKPIKEFDFGLLTVEKPDLKKQDKTENQVKSEEIVFETVIEGSEKSDQTKKNKKKKKKGKQQEEEKKEEVPKIQSVALQQRKEKETFLVHDGKATKFSNLKPRIVQENECTIQISTGEGQLLVRFEKKEDAHKFIVKHDELRDEKQQFDLNNFINSTKQKEEFAKFLLNQNQ